MKQNIGRIFAVKISISFVAQFWGMAGFVVFFAAWLAHNGLSEFQIALILGVSQFVKSLFAPFAALFADGFKYKKTPILYMNFLGIISASALYFVDEYVAIFIVTIFYSISSSAIIPILDGLSMKGAEKLKFDYGHTRLWGSVSFMVAAIVCGILIDRWNLDLLLPWLLFGAVIALLAGLFLPVLPSSKMTKPRKVGTKSKRFDMDGALTLVKQPIFMAILVAISIILASHSVYYGFSTIHWQKIGYSSDLIGILWAVGIVAEVLLFAYSSKFSLLLGPRRMIILGAAAAVIRWTITAFDPPLYLLFIAQLLHAFTFAATYLGALHLITRSVPEPLISTAMAINASLNAGIFMALAMFFGGLLYSEYSNWAYLFAAILAVVGLVFALGLKFIWDGQALVFEEIEEK
ncbi:MAG: MFS transporter [Rhizobiales bacterium]|nr:MFS transporter [Hyphomicrobiales bacterium]